MLNIHMQVIKRSGKTEQVSFDKVTKRIKLLCGGLENVDPILIAQKVCGEIYNNVHTYELDELAAQICVAMSTENPKFGILASRIIISNNHKTTSPSFSETMTALYNNRDILGNHTPMLAEDVYQVIMKHKDKLNNVIDYKRDYNFDYFAFKTLEKAYLFKINNVIVERVQHMFMRVSIGIHSNDIGKAIESYNFMSQKYFTHATPTLYNAGTPRPQNSSCFLLGTDDSIESMYSTIKDCALISKWAGGIGIHISNIRSKGTHIRGTNGKSDGIIPMLKVYNETAVHVNQGGGKRPGAFAIYLEPHHPDIMQFLDLKKNHGNEEERARDLFLALWISDLFMERVEADTEWSLLDPDECPGLNDVYGDEYKELYERYEKEGRARKVVQARDVWKKALDSQMETGTPYISYKDSVNRKSNQKHYGIIRSSNLCNEITLYSDKNEYAVCNLSSICLPMFVENNNKYNYKKLEEVVRIAVTNLNRIVDYNFYPVPQAEYSNKKHRPIGLGVQGLADVFYKMRAPYESDRAREINRNIFETMYYAAVKTSCELAKVEGPYETFQGSPMSLGQFQFDLWGVKPSDRYDWEELRQEVMKYGIRNSTLMAIMPTASTAQIMGNTEACEQMTSNIYARRTGAGDFVVINKYLVEDLIKLDLWNKDLKNMIIADNGSIQNINGIPQELKNLYKTAWEVKQKAVIQLAADRGPFICQTQSMNLFFEEPTYNVLHSALFFGWKSGLKTGSYYIRSRPKVQAQQFTIDPEKLQNRKQTVEAEKLMCSLANPEACEMCSG
jgi:ribonucleoside-diphosphate reductase alpha subunit